MKYLGKITDPKDLVTKEYVDSGLSDKMDKTNPSGTGSLSLNRQANTTIGTNSVAEGQNTVASANYSHAEGYFSEATGENSHAEGQLTRAIANSGHAEGRETEAAGTYAHSEG